MSEPLPDFICKRAIRGRYVFFDLDPSTETELVVTCAGWEEFGQSFQIKRDNFHFHAIECIVTGQWLLETAQGKWEIGPGTLFSYGPTSGFSLTALSEGISSKYFVDFYGQKTTGLFNRIGVDTGHPAYLIRQRWLFDILDQLIETANMKVGSRRTSIANLLVCLFAERIKSDTQGRGDPSKTRRKYEICRQYISENYLTIRSISEVATVCKITPVHLARVFRRFDKEGPKDYLTRLKMNHAAEKVLRGGVLVKEAAEEVGFDDAYHFSRVFKKYFGLAPAHYAAQCESLAPRVS